MPPQLLGQDYWGGVCGFISVIHGILLSKNDGDALDGLSQDELEYNLGLSILAFLKYVKVQKPAIAKELVDFTRTFPGHEKKNIHDLTWECDQSVNRIKMHGNTEGSQVTEAGWGIAMTKNALLAYIDWIGAKATEKAHTDAWTKENLSTFKKCVCGVGDTKEKGNGFLGLRHWVYINEAGYMYNWGKKTRMNKSPDPPYIRGNHNYLVHVLQLT
jgi:hypothetical protein